ncbi:MAG: DUF2007 domain-containing protein [Sediminibacterium sp.]|jgi:hypothetical protein
MQDWKKIFSTTQLAYATMVAGLLEEQGIPTNLLNKQDTSYVFLGEVELYTPFIFEEKALSIIAEIN